MLNILCLLACLLSVTLAVDNWTNLNQELCFEAKGRKPGTFKLPTGGFLQGVRLNHKSGGVTCATSAEMTKFGCVDDPGAIGILIADQDDKVVLPLEVRKHKWKFSFSSGNGPNSPIVSLYDDHSPTYFDKDTELKVWYSDDFYKTSTHDNSGKSCATVEVLFAQ